MTKSLEEYAKECGASSSLTDQSTGGDLTGYGNLPAPISHDCPHCGRCPYCGRGGYGYVPNYPIPWPGYYPQPYIGDPSEWDMNQYKVYCGSRTGVASSATNNTADKQY